MKVLETDRLVLRWLEGNDAPFIVELLNDASFIRFIGDKGVRSLDEARNYILDGPVASYKKFGFGLNAVDLKDGNTPLGICGILKRDTLPHPDIGFAFLPAHRNKGYAYEASAAVLEHAKNNLGIDRVLAITTPDNEASAKLLVKLGLRFDRLIKLTPDADEVKLFAVEFETEP
jgi:RimJ/RimL family protein N-acetyltransferase